MSGSMYSADGKLVITRLRVEKNEYPAEVLEAAEKTGVTLPPLPETPAGLSDDAINKIKNHPERLAFWFAPTKNAVTIDMEDIGRQSEFPSDLDTLLEIIREDGCVADGTLFTKNYDGEFYRYRVKDGVLLGEDQARIVWPDGTEGFRS